MSKVRAELDKELANYERTNWTPNEDQLLIDFCGKLPATVLADKLGRSAYSIHHRLSKLNVKSGPCKFRKIKE